MFTGIALPECNTFVHKFDVSAVVVARRALFKSGLSKMPSIPRVENNYFKVMVNALY